MGESNSNEEQTNNGAETIQNQEEQVLTNSVKILLDYLNGRWNKKVCLMHFKQVSPVRRGSIGM